MELQKAFAEVNLNALSHNLKVVQDRTGNKSVLAVVKADAYGHGAIQISNHLIKKGISKLGVAYTFEAIALRESGIIAPILVFFDRENMDACFQFNLTPVIFDLATAKRFSSEARRLNKQIPVHIKIDSGMGRIGFPVKKACAEIIKISSLKNIRLEGLMSHFSEADLQDKDYANQQIERFRSIEKELKEKNVSFRFRHMANSAAVLSMPESHFNMVRPGIMLYGYGCCERDNLKPILSLKSSFVFLKTVPAGTSISYGRTFVTKRRSIIGTIPVGYADGYNRKLSNTGEVLVNGRRAPVVGRVCMDTVMIDVTDIRDVDYKSEVVLLGRQGKERITADDIADETGTIAYEVLTSVGPRIQRVYT